MPFYARAILASGALLILASSVTRASDASELASLPHAKFPAPAKVVSGAIDGEQIEAVRDAGIRHIVNLRPAQENPQFDEAGAVEASGLQYHHLPIAGAQSLTRENVAAFDEMLEEIGDEPTLLHCASGNRVGALVALREAWVHGRPLEEAIAEGKRWGLTGLEGAVREKLE